MILVDFLKILTDFSLEFISRTGYWGIFSMSFLDRLTVFLIPAEVILPAFGILIDRGRFLFWPAFLMVTIGNFFGNLGLYYIFLKGGRPFLEQHGKYFLIKKHELSHMDRWFSKYGERIVIFGYLLPATIRSLVPIVAGVSKMNVGKFSLYTFIWSIPLNFLYVFVGIKTGENYDRILVFFEKFNYITIVALVIFIVWYIIRHVKGRHLTHS